MKVKKQLAAANFRNAAPGGISITRESQFLRMIASQLSQSSCGLSKRSLAFLTSWRMHSSYFTPKAGSTVFAVLCCCIWTLEFSSTLGSKAATRSAVHLI